MNTATSSVIGCFHPLAAITRFAIEATITARECSSSLNHVRLFYSVECQMLNFGLAICSNLVGRLHLLFELRNRKILRNHAKNTTRRRKAVAGHARAAL